MSARSQEKRRRARLATGVTKPPEKSDATRGRGVMAPRRNGVASVARPMPAGKGALVARRVALRRRLAAAVGEYMAKRGDDPEVRKAYDENRLNAGHCNRCGAVAISVEALPSHCPSCGSEAKEAPPELDPTLPHGLPHGA